MKNGSGSNRSGRETGGDIHNRHKAHKTCGGIRSSKKEVKEATA